MERAAIIGTKAIIVFFVALSLLGQIVVIPFLASEVATEYPEFAHLKIIGIIGCVAIVASVQVALLCTWRLVTLVKRDTIFQPAAFRIVNILIASFLTVGVLAFIGNAIVAFAGAGHPSILLLSTVTISASLGIALLLVIMKELLRKASTYAHDLTEVI